MEIQAQVLQAERAIARQSCSLRENALKSNLAEAEDREQKAEIGGGGKCGFWGRSLRS